MKKILIAGMLGTLLAAGVPRQAVAGSSWDSGAVIGALAGGLALGHAFGQQHHHHYYHHGYHHPGHSYPGYYRPYRFYLYPPHPYPHSYYFSFGFGSPFPYGYPAYGYRGPHYHRRGCGHPGY
jgi:hypothetical protein